MLINNLNTKSEKAAYEVMLLFACIRKSVHILVMRCMYDSLESKEKNTSYFFMLRDVICLYFRKARI